MPLTNHSYRTGTQYLWVIVRPKGRGFGFVDNSGFPKGQPSYAVSTHGRFPTESVGISLGNGYPCPQYIYGSVYVSIVV